VSRGIGQEESLREAGHFEQAEARHGMELACQRRVKMVRKETYDVWDSATGVTLDKVCSEGPEHMPFVISLLKIKKKKTETSK
jgi:hypothetical protein